MLSKLKHQMETAVKKSSLTKTIILKNKALTKDRFIKETLTLLVLSYLFFLLYLLLILEVIPS